MSNLCAIYLVTGKTIVGYLDGIETLNEMTNRKAAMIRDPIDYSGQYWLQPTRAFPMFPIRTFPIDLAHIVLMYDCFDREISDVIEETIEMAYRDP